MIDQIGTQATETKRRRKISKSNGRLKIERELKEGKRSMFRREESAKRPSKKFKKKLWQSISLRLW